MISVGGSSLLAWVIGEIQQKAPNLEYDVAPIPRWTAGGPHKTPVGQDGLYVSGKSKNQESGAGTGAWEHDSILLLHSRTSNR